MHKSRSLAAFIRLSVTRATKFFDFSFYQRAQIVRADAQLVARVRQGQIFVHIFLVDYLQRMVAESLALMPLRTGDNIPRVKAERNKLVFILLVKVEGQAGHERIVGGKQLRSGVAVRQNADASVRGSKNLNDNIINALARLSGKYLVKERLYLILAPYLQKLFELIDGFSAFSNSCVLLRSWSLIYRMLPVPSEV